MELIVTEIPILVCLWLVTLALVVAQLTKSTALQYRNSNDGELARSRQSGLTTLKTEFNTFH